jgi:hypothetical protein
MRWLAPSFKNNGATFLQKQRCHLPSKTTVPPSFKNNGAERPADLVANSLRAIGVFKRTDCRLRGRTLLATYNRAFRFGWWGRFRF